LSELVVIDSSFVIALERAERDFHEIEGLNLILPTPVIAEILTGIELSSKPDKAARAKEKLSMIQSVMAIADFDIRAAEAFANLSSSESNRSSPRSVFDLMIAAITVSNGATLLTLDKRANWQKLPGVKLHPISNRLQ